MKASAIWISPCHIEKELLSIGRICMRNQMMQCFYHVHSSNAYLSMRFKRCGSSHVWNFSAASPSKNKEFETQCSSNLGLYWIRKTSCRRSASVIAWLTHLCKGARQMDRYVCMTVKQAVFQFEVILCGSQQGKDARFCKNQVAPQSRLEAVTLAAQMW